jgi:hypothetical protein
MITLDESNTFSGGCIITVTKDVEASNIATENKKWIRELLNQKKMLSFREKMLYIYDKYADLLPHLSKVVGRKEEFANLVTEYRHKLTHGNINYNQLNNEDLFWKYKDIQLILQLCILSELGYSGNRRNYI